MQGRKETFQVFVSSFLFSSLAFFFCLRGVCVSSACCGCPNRLTKQQFFLTRSFALACVFCAFLNIIIFFLFFKVVSGLLLFIWDPSLRLWELRIGRGFDVQFGHLVFKMKKKSELTRQQQILKK